MARQDEPTVVEDAPVMQIGELAERIGLSLRTIRYYGEVGLAPPTARSEGGFRLYTESDLHRFEIIKRMKPLGFSLAEMKDLLDALEVLSGDDDAAHESSATAARCLQTCRSKAQDSVARLQKHLAYAEELTELLTTLSGGAVGTTRD